jgi:hypothetical protein
VSPGTTLGDDAKDDAAVTPPVARTGVESPRTAPASSPNVGHGSTPPIPTLIGRSFTDDGVTYTVASFWELSPTYVLVNDGEKEHMRPTGVVARRIELDDQAA